MLETFIFPKLGDPAKTMSEDTLNDALRTMGAMLPLDVTRDESGDEPTVVADVVLQAAIAVRPKLRYTAGGLANRLRLLRRFAPVRLVDAGIRKDLRPDVPTVSLPRHRTGHRPA